MVFIYLSIYLFNMNIVHKKAYEQKKIYKNKK